MVNKTFTQILISIPGIIYECLNIRVFEIIWQQNYNIYSNNKDIGIYHLTLCFRNSNLVTLQLYSIAKNGDCKPIMRVVKILKEIYYNNYDDNNAINEL